MKFPKKMCLEIFFFETMFGRFSIGISIRFSKRMPIEISEYISRGCFEVIPGRFSQLISDMIDEKFKFSLFCTSKSIGHSLLHYILCTPGVYTRYMYGIANYVDYLRCQKSMSDATV